MSEARRSSVRTKAKPDRARPGGAAATSCRQIGESCVSIEMQLKHECLRNSQSVDGYAGLMSDSPFSARANLAPDHRGTSAVEFALVAPILFAVVFGIVCYGTVLGTYHGVQELASEAARASVGGLSDQERAQLAYAYVRTNVGSYAFIDPTKLLVASQSTGNPATAYQVTVTYDMSQSFVYRMGGFVPMPDPLIQRSAVVRFGGY